MEDTITIIIYLAIAIVGLLIGFFVGGRQSKKRNIIWGLITLLAGPALAYAFSMYIVGEFAQDPWVAMATLFITATLLITVSISLLLSGIFRKKISNIK